MHDVLNPRHWFTERSIYRSICMISLSWLLNYVNIVWIVCCPKKNCTIPDCIWQYRSAMCRQANLKIDWHKCLSRWYISIEIQTKITKFNSVISCWLRSFALTQASSQFLSFQAMRIPILCCGLWLPPIRLSSSFPSKWKSKFVSFLFGFLVHSPLGKIRTAPCYFHPPEHFFVPLFGFHFSFLTIFFLSRQSIPIPDQIQPLLLFQVSVIHSDFYFLSVFASVVFALLLSYSCSLLLLRCFALDFLQFFLCTSALSQFLAVTLSRPPVSILSALRLAFKLSEL